MNEQNKKRIIGAGALVVAAVVAVWLLKILATPAEAPDGESVRVYEILPNGQARAVGAEESNADDSKKRANNESPDEPGVKSAIAKPTNKPMETVTRAKPETEPEPRPEPANEPKKTEPKQVTQAPAPREVLAPNAAAKPEPSPKPAATKKPEPSPTTSVKKTTPEISSGEWLVQVGSFGEQDNADRVVEKLTPRVPARVSRAVVNGKTYYRVQTGPYDSEAQAKSAEKKLQGQGYGARALQSP